VQELIALGQVIFIDIVLAGDNAVVVGMAAAGVPRDRRTRVIFWGIAAAVVLRILFALIATQLLAIIGLTLAGGILLLWVCWRLWRELRGQAHDPDAAIAEIAGAAEKKSGAQAIRQIVIADLSMSLDNVLAVAGAAEQHLVVLVIGLLFSVVLMGAAASVIARVLVRVPWLAYVGLTVIAYVSLHMIWDGGHEVVYAVM
jgi:YjbE family integral membrane protein